MLGRALITAAAVAVWLLLPPRQPLEGARKTRNGPEPCAFVVTDQSSLTVVARSSRDCFQIR
ncbi:hypothetical protein ABIC50_000241 [Burkholderia sp. 567]